MEQSEYKLDIIPRADGGMRTTCPSKSFVKVTHLESGISLTNFGRNQHEAREKVLADLEYFVSKWKHA